MGDSDGIIAASHNHRLGITYPAGTCGGIAVMTYGDTAGELAQGLLGEYLRNQAHTGKDLKFFTVGGSNASAFLAAVL